MQIGASTPLLSSASQGIQRAMTKANQAGEQLASGNLDPMPLIDLTEAAAEVKMNAAVMRTGDELLGTLLNVKR